MATAAERLKQYEDLFQRSQGYDTAKYQQDFEKAYNEAANYNKDLIEQKAGYISQAQALPSQMREQYYTSPIRNPLAQEALIATRRGALTGDVNRIVDLLAARGARYQDVLGKHLSAYESEAQRAATAAENAWRLYQDAQAQEEAARARAAARALASLLQQPTGGAGVKTTTPINIQEARYDEFKRQGYSDEEAFSYATQGVPQDQPTTAERGGVLGLLGKVWGPGLDWLSNAIYGGNANRYGPSKPTGSSW
jgi:hypothetical protein